MQKTEHPLRPIRSFVRREGRITKSQQQALEHLFKKFGLTVEQGVLNFNGAFTYVLEIGFGMGDSLVQQARQNPDKHYIGVEVHRPGVGSILSQIEKNKLDNIRVFCADAHVVLKNCVSDDSLDEAQIFFPDPWPKKRHHKRRLIQIEFVGLLRQKLKSGGKLHLATDWKEYALHMLTVMENAHGWKKDELCSFERPATKFEIRGRQLGHEVWNFVFMKN